MVMFKRDYSAGRKGLPAWKIEREGRPREVFPSFEAGNQRLGRIARQMRRHRDLSRAEVADDLS